LTIETKMYLKNRVFIKKTPWICGCEETNAFFCFVCLLFGRDDKWTNEGVCHLKHLVTKINKHEGPKKHKNNYVRLRKIEIFLQKL
jgi:hypothetical protein